MASAGRIFLALFCGVTVCGASSALCGCEACNVTWTAQGKKGAMANFMAVDCEFLMTVMAANEITVEYGMPCSTMLNSLASGTLFGVQTSKYMVKEETSCASNLMVRGERLATTTQQEINDFGTSSSMSLETTATVSTTLEETATTGMATSTATQFVAMFSTQLISSTTLAVDTDDSEPSVTTTEVPRSSQVIVGTNTSTIARTDTATTTSLITTTADVEATMSSSSGSDSNVSVGESSTSMAPQSSADGDSILSACPPMIRSMLSVTCVSVLGALLLL